MQAIAPSNQNNEQTRRSLEKAREIGAANEDPAAENLKRLASEPPSLQRRENGS